MEYEYENQKKGHGLLAVILGILGILIVFFAGLPFGLFGIVPALVLAVLAIVLGINTKRATGQGGKGGVISGIIAVFFCLMSFMLIMAIKTGFKSPQFQEMSPTLAAHSDQCLKGLLGVFLTMDEDEQKKVQAELEAYGKKNGLSTEVTADVTTAEVTTEAAQ